MPTLRWWSCALLTLLLGFLFGKSAGADDNAELIELYRQRELFALRDRLADLDESAATAEIGFLEAAIEQAFNRPHASNEIIARLLAAENLDLGLRLRLLNLQLTNYFRLHRYDAALAVARIILAAEAPDSAVDAVRAAENKLPLLTALQDVPPQEVDMRGPSRLALGQTRRVPLKIQGQRRQLGLDTGANLSVLMRSEAEKLGLTIRPAGVVISTSTARKVLGDVAVAETVEIGKIRYSHVAFLVLPDELLTFADGHRIPGLVGFPLVEAMGEVRFRRDNVLEIPGRPPRRTQGNLALDDLDPLTPVHYAKQDLVCRLDTGAGHTVFYEPFFTRFRDTVERNGHSVETRAGGVGGFQEIPAYRLSRIVVDIASAGVTLRDVDVYTQPIRAAEENYLYCNIGLDALVRFRSYSINFRDMALVVD